jgi:hypothetical protein
MAKDITPEGSIVPIYLDPTPKAQQEADAIADAELEARAQLKATQKAALLERLGLTEAEAALLIS